MPMNVNITPRLEALLRWEVDSGRYASAGEIIRETLRLMAEEDRLRAMKRETARCAVRNVPIPDA